MNIAELMERATKEALMRTGIELVCKNPEKNMGELLEIMNKATINDSFNCPIIESIKEQYKNDKSTRDFMQNIVKTTNKKCLEKFAVNFFANNLWFGMKKRGRLFKCSGTKQPFVFSITDSIIYSTETEGTYDSSYKKKKQISFKQIEKAIKQEKERGIYCFIILELEEFLCDNMVKIYEKHNDCIFAPFINATWIDEKKANTMQKLANITPLVSVVNIKEDENSGMLKELPRNIMCRLEFLQKSGVLFAVHNIDNYSELENITFKNIGTVINLVKN